ncbi:N6 adenine-specific DNA methyltransferase, N12 class [Roseibium sp. TrichSKD4]|uniref:DUF4942 domain-containing protein n=1 Tax=Roseibium sp. TrichSKD4 TaxID=744980 RepID=UPI0001E56B4B|nr:DUF4942 domain-containing protein [Roseibium sp. TrichSKD4]EFO30119.1 N6 adenine-specific DNA methyltransferase, N12 class [Roseibium sp. TrichSKD4]
MNAIVPRQTVEQVVTARDQTLEKYEHAFEKVEEANEALKEARAMWKQAAPDFDGRYYEAGREAESFFKVVSMPDRYQYLATAKRLVDITVWQHVVSISGIEDLMDRNEKEKLRDQMKYRAPHQRSAMEVIDTLERYADDAEDPNEHGIGFRIIRHFEREIEALEDHPEILEALSGEGVDRIRAASRRILDSVASISGGSGLLEGLTNTIQKLEEWVATPKGLPPVTVDNIMATLTGLLGQSNDIFLRGIANSFSSLDRRFRSHDGFKIGNRIIITRLCDDWGYVSHGYKEDTFHDVERIFKLLDGGKPGALYGSILETVRRERLKGTRAHQSEHEGDYFKIRVFKNGNAHLWFTRKDLLTKVNKLLAEYYGEVVGDGQCSEEDPLFNQKTTPAKRYGFFPTPDPAADRVLEKVDLRRGIDEPELRILEPSAGTGQLAKRATRKIAARHNYRVEENGRTSWESTDYTCKALVDCVELQPHLADDLESTGLFNRVMCADFLKLDPAVTGLYDRVIMNPPFDRERDIDHVVHALSFLKPGGTLTAIMSAGTEFRETKKSKAFRDLIGKMNARMQDLPERSFAESGTSVNTLVLHIKKPAEK